MFSEILNTKFEERNLNLETFESAEFCCVNGFLSNPDIFLPANFWVCGRTKLADGVTLSQSQSFSPLSFFPTDNNFFNFFTLLSCNKKYRSSYSFKRKGTLISLSNLAWAKFLSLCTCTRSFARANDAIIVRNRDSQCNAQESPWFSSWVFLMPINNKKENTVTSYGHAMLTFSKLLIMMTMARWKTCVILDENRTNAWLDNMIGNNSVVN